MNLRFRWPLYRIDTCYECGHNSWGLRWLVWRVRPLTPQQIAMLDELSPTINMYKTLEALRKIDDTMATIVGQELSATIDTKAAANAVFVFSHPSGTHAEDANGNPVAWP